MLRKFFSLVCQRKNCTKNNNQNMNNNLCLREAGLTLRINKSLNFSERISCMPSSVMTQFGNRNRQQSDVASASCLSYERCFKTVLEINISFTFTIMRWYLQFSIKFLNYCILKQYYLLIYRSAMTC